MLDLGAGTSRPIASLHDQLRRVAGRAVARAGDLDEDGAFPSEDIADLAAIGALAAAFHGEGRSGSAVGAPVELAEALRLVGHASLPLGRLFEGHINAAALITRYGTAAQQEQARGQAERGALFGVWNTEGADGVRLVRKGSGLRLTGAKTFASGAGHVDRPLITARDAAGDLFMVLPRLDAASRADLSRWQAHGMRASASGDFSFEGLAVAPSDLIGKPGDYHRQPHFSAGAWRFCAVQLGGIERIVEEARAELRGRGRTGDPHQLARMGEAAVAAETAALWVRAAARLAEDLEADATAEAAERAVAYVNLARSAVERCGLDVLERVQRSVGLSAFQRASPLERLMRDLATYLRQPAPDRALEDGAAYMLRREEALGDIWRCS